MATIYLIRHGESAANAGLKNVWNGNYTFNAIGAISSARSAGTFA